jgi:NitT/TauT family transport system substrate-binding protein
MQTRRRFLTTLSMASAAGLLRAQLLLAAEGALETTTVRIAKLGAACLAPQFVAEELLRAEGFTDVRYVDTPPAAIGLAIGRGEVDFSTAFAIDSIQAIDGGAPVVVLAGVHIGCYELLASEAIRSIRELKGKSVGLQGSPPNLLTLMASHVGLNPTRDIRWVTQRRRSLQLLEFGDSK